MDQEEAASKGEKRLGEFGVGGRYLCGGGNPAEEAAVDR